MDSKFYTSTEDGYSNFFLTFLKGAFVSYVIRDLLCCDLKFAW